MLSRIYNREVYGEIREFVRLREPLLSMEPAYIVRGARSREPSSGFHRALLAEYWAKISSWLD